MSENQEIVGGRYRILGRLGKGAMGVVFMAYDPVLDRKVAIKQVAADIARDERIRQRFCIEARAAARLNHPNIVTIHELQDSGDDIYMVMELMEGTSLAQLVAARGMPLSLEETLDAMAQVCDGLDYAHQHAVVHRDIKPANLFIAPSGVVKILDFGIARVGSLHVTADGAMVGTPDYMSPEQVRGDEIDARADLWAAGVVLYQLLSGKKPFEGAPLAVLLAAIIGQPHVRLRERVPEIAPPVSDLVDRLLAKNREERPASAGVVRDELRTLLGGRATRATSGVVKRVETEETVVGSVCPPLPSPGVVPPPLPVPNAALSPPPAEPQPPATVPPAVAPSVAASVPEPPAIAAPPVPPVAEAVSQPAAIAAPAVPPPPGAAVPSQPPAAQPVTPRRAPAPPAARRSGVALVVGGLLIIVLLASAAAILLWPSFGPRLLQVAGLGGAAPAAQATQPPPATPPAAQPQPAGANPVAVGESPRVEGQVGSAQAPGTPEDQAASASAPASPPAASPIDAAPLEPVAPPTAGAGQRPREANHPPAAVTPTTASSRQASRAEASAAAEPPRARPAGSGAPEGPADERRTTPRAAPPQPVREKLTDETVAAFSGRSGGSYDLAGAGATVAAVNRINYVLGQYAAALNARDADALRGVRRSPGDAETQLLRARAVSVRIESVDVKVTGTAATARARRTIDATLASGEHLREDGAVTFSLVREPTRWVITDVR